MRTTTELQGRQKGFTLVELSIVLVIIGLLIGGILAGQSMIENARKYQYIRELQSFKIAYGGFEETLKEKPGDFSRRIEMMGGSINGNGNGVIQWNTAEANYVWIDLKNFNYPDIYPKDFGYGSTYITRNKKNSLVGTDFYYTYNGDLYSAASISEPVVTLARAPGSGGVNGVSIKAGTLVGIDGKIDDGLPQVGKVRGYTGSVNGDGVAYPGTATTCSQDVSGTHQYKVDGSTENCRMFFLIESN